MHARWIILPLQCLGGAENRHAVTPAHSRFWSRISGHGVVKGVEALDAALFGRATTIVGHRSNVADHSEIEAYCLQRADCGFASCSRSSHQNFHFLKPMAHRLSGGVLRNHLRRVRGALTRAFKANFAGARPSDHVALHVGNRHDRIVELRKHMRDTRINVLAAFGFDDLRFLNVSRKRKVLRSRCCGSSWLFLFFFGCFFSGVEWGISLCGCSRRLAFAGIRWSRRRFGLARFGFFRVWTGWILWVSHNSNASFKLCRLWLPDCVPRLQSFVGLSWSRHLSKCAVHARVSPCDAGCRDKS